MPCMGPIYKTWVNLAGEEETEPFFSSSGILLYSVVEGYGHRLILTVPPSIVEYYRALVPKAFGINTTRYEPHISVVRKETPTNMAVWGKYQGSGLYFSYSPIVCWDERYFWLRVNCPQLVEIRKELGLPPTKYGMTEPPVTAPCFHVTIGNVKT